MTKKIRNYGTEIKAEAVKNVADNNGKVSTIAKQLGIAMQTLSNLQNKANQSKLVGTEQYDSERSSLGNKVGQASAPSG